MTCGGRGPTLTAGLWNGCRDGTRGGLDGSDRGSLHAGAWNAWGAKGRTMGNVEYKSVNIQWKDEVESRLDQLVDAVNVYAKDGWRVASVDLTAHGSFAVKTLPVLLERDVQAK
jgi:hypothetical protein